MSHNTIIIKNQTGSSQSYNIFSEKPQVEGPNAAKVKTHVYLSCGRVPNGGTAKFRLSKKYYAVLGTHKGSAGGNEVTTISSVKPVTLGRGGEDCATVHGTTLNMVVNEGAPTFDEALGEPSGLVGAFCVKTHGDFLIDEARDGNFFLGVTTSPEDPTAALMASYMPEPQVVYQIQPVEQFYITAESQYKVGEVVKDSKAQDDSLAVDFRVMHGIVTVVHGAEGTMIILK